MKDSVDKVITRYFACLTKEDFVYKGETFKAKPLTISPLLLRGYTCPSHCGGCCSANTLDYLPSEDKPQGVKKRLIDFNKEQIEIWSDLQRDGDSQCRHLNRKDGRCGVYLVRPFSCDFELIRPLAYLNEDKPNVLTQKLYGRGWNMLRIDGGRGAMCEMTPVSNDTIAEVIRKLDRLEQWASHFGIGTWAGDIVELIVTHKLTRSITLGGSKHERSVRCSHLSRGLRPPSPGA